MAYSVANELVLLGNKVLASDGTTSITTTASTGAIATGGSVTVASGQNVIMQGSGCLQVGAAGTICKTSGGTTALTLNGSGDVTASTNFTVTSNLTLTGNTIKSSSAATVIDFDSDAVRFNSAYKFPTSDGSANQVLKTDGSGTLTFENDSSGGLTSSRQTTSFTAAADNFYFCDFSSTATVTLPTAVSGAKLFLKAGGSVSGSVIVKVLSAAASATIDGVDRSATALDLLLSPYASASITCCTDGTNLAWYIG